MNSRIAAKLAAPKTKRKPGATKSTQLNYPGRPTVKELDEYYARREDPTYYTMRLQSVSSLSGFERMWSETTGEAVWLMTRHGKEGKN